MSERKGTKALELWCRRLVKDCPNVQIENMTTSWRSGVAFCALVHHFRPDLIDMSVLDPANIYENNQLAFNIAEKHLGIPALLDPEDMVENEVPDRLSILTYLSQFYQRLGHTVSTKANESDSKLSSPVSPASSSQSAAELFGKVGLDKCAACGLPVYLAQRLIVSHKLYHRRCYRCSKCLTQLNPGNINNNAESVFICDNCVIEGTSVNYLSQDDAQMGMLAFTDDIDAVEEKFPSPIRETPKRRSQSILDKISMFEKNAEEGLEEKLENLSVKDKQQKSGCHNKPDMNTASGSKSIVNESLSVSQVELQKQHDETAIITDNLVKAIETNLPRHENTYKSDKNKYTFLQTQLTDTADDHNAPDISDSGIQELENSKPSNQFNDLQEESNATDDTRIANNSSQTFPLIDSISSTELEAKKEDEISINVPPRRKKRISADKSLINEKVEDAQKNASTLELSEKLYPDHLNPFFDEEEEHANPFSEKKRDSTNPFGSSDDDEDVPAAKPPPMIAVTQPNADNSPQKRLITANPFWSDGEEPSSDEEHRDSSSMYQSSIATSTPNLRVSTPRRKKAPAPPPPAPLTPLPPLAPLTPLTPAATAGSTDDVASLSSMSSYNSTVHSDQKSCGKLTPRLKKRVAPTPPDSISTVSALSDVTAANSTEKGEDLSGSWKHQKRPAPGLPLPARREVREVVPPAQLASRLELLEAQQAGLERQGVRLEQLIRDKCEGAEGGEGGAGAGASPQEVEELVIQLCELVNEKNELFRKQTELMYIRRQQRLEQEQADIEHEIRVIQSRPAVNRIDSDKAREEGLVARLVALVRLRDELVQQLDAERRRERREDRAIAACIAARRAQRSSESNSSSMKSDVQAAPAKKSKVKDKMKKQFKKAKHSLIPKKKDDSPKESKDKPEKAK